MFVGVVNISTWQISIVSIIYHMVITYGLIMTMLNTVAINFAKDFLSMKFLLTPWTVRIITYRILANRNIVKAFYQRIPLRQLGELNKLSLPEYPRFRYSALSIYSPVLTFIARTVIRKSLHLLALINFFFTC